MAETATPRLPLRWYHTIDLPGGVSTPGEYDLRPIVDRLPWPKSMAGMRCLDVGSRDGFYTFHMERLGAAEVVSLDVGEPEQIDFPGPRPEPAAIAAEIDAGHRAFEAARVALGSRAQRVPRRRLRALEAAHGRFDFAVIGTLLHHLRDPGRALAATRSVLDGPLLVNDAVIPGIDSLRRRPRPSRCSTRARSGRCRTRPGSRGWSRRRGSRCSRPGGRTSSPAGPGRAPRRSPLCLGPPLRDVPRRLLARRGALHAWVLGGPP